MGQIRKGTAGENELTKKGYRQSAETRKRMSEAQFKRFENDNIWNKNRDWSPEVRKSISEGMKKYWATVDDSRRQQAREVLCHNNPMVKRAIIDKNNNRVK